MECPRCQSTRVQRGYRDTRILVRLWGGQELLCNNCGLEFKGFSWLASFSRAPAKSKQADLNRRRSPRYKVHLPARIRLVAEGTVNDVSLSPVMLGQCQTISSRGMALSFVGSHLNQAEFTKPGRRLLVTIKLPTGTVEALVKTVTHQRVEHKDGPASWFVGTSLVQISDADRARLSAYIDKRAAKLQH